MAWALGSIIRGHLYESVDVISVPISQEGSGLGIGIYYQRPSVREC